MYAKLHLLLRLFDYKKDAVLDVENKLDAAMTSCLTFMTTWRTEACCVDVYDHLSIWKT